MISLLARSAGKIIELQPPSSNRPGPGSFPGLERASLLQVLLSNLGVLDTESSRQPEALSSYLQVAYRIPGAIS